MRLVVTAFLVALLPLTCMAGSPALETVPPSEQVASRMAPAAGEVAVGSPSTEYLLHARVSGEGDPVVFLAGLLGSERYWNSAFEPLTQTHRLIYVDALGFGRSPQPDVAYTIDDQVAALHTTLVRLGATHHVTIVAHSFGTVIAAKYAATYPDDVSRLVLLGTPLFDSPEEARERLATISPSAMYYLRHPRVVALTCRARERFPRLSRFLVRLTNRSLTRETANDTLLHTWPSFRGALQGLIDTRVESLLARSGARIVFVHGVGDRVTPAGAVSEVARRLGADLVLVSGGHQDYLRLHAVELTSIVGDDEPANTVRHAEGDSSGADRLTAPPS